MDTAAACWGYSISPELWRSRLVSIDRLSSGVLDKRHRWSDSALEHFDTPAALAGNRRALVVPRCWGNSNTVAALLPPEHTPEPLEHRWAEAPHRPAPGQRNTGTDKRTDIRNNNADRDDTAVPRFQCPLARRRRLGTMER